MPWVERASLVLPDPRNTGYRLIEFNVLPGEQSYGVSYDKDGTGDIGVLRVGFYGPYLRVSGRVVIEPSLDLVPTLEDGVEFLNRFSFQALDAVGYLDSQRQGRGVYFAPVSYCPPGVVRVFALTP